MERRARKWSGFTCKRASEDTTLRARSTEEEEEEEEEEEGGEIAGVSDFLIRAARP